MVYHGLSMVYLWFIYGLSMVYLWFVYGLSMVYLWFSYGLSMVYAGYLAGNGGNRCCVQTKLGKLVL